MSARKRARATGVDWERLGAREREILEILFARGEATAAQVLEGLKEKPSYSAVRGMLALLEQKGHVAHRRDGLRYVYSATADADHERGSAIKRMVDTFFGGSPARAVATLLDLPEDEADDVSLAELRKAVLAAQRARK
ncbi:MAG: BlaI/MecI/CopY family transcriptional regulator [Gemmatimonadaceae bacterium]